MRKVGCVIHDAKDDTYSAPVFYDSVADAVLDFCKGIDGDNLEMSSRPADFNLFQIGFWDDKKFRLIVSRSLLFVGRKYADVCKGLAEIQ